jgi:carboxypeptidase Taq
MPYLERKLDFSREYSPYFAPYKHVADPHIDDADEGMIAASIRTLFDELERELVPLVHTTCEQPAVDDSVLRQTFAKPAQFDFALHVAECLGYDLKRGRLDLTHHPFCTRFSAGDVRITTRNSRFRKLPDLSITWTLENCSRISLAVAKVGVMSLLGL